MDNIKLLKHLIIIIAELLVICVLMLGITKFKNRTPKEDKKAKSSSSKEKDKEKDGVDKLIVDDGTVTDAASETDASSDSIFSYPEIEFNPHCVDSTKPTNYFAQTDVIVDDNIIDKSSYKPADTISFDVGEKYTKNVDGVITFRGNNFRDNPTYGYADIKEGSMEAKWSVPTGGVTIGDYSWSGSGWTGQPLIRKWPKELRQHMNMWDLFI